MAALATASLSSCSLEPLAQAIEFKSGAVYTGNFTGGKKSGHGTFWWPSGLQYTGEYVENKRHGRGVQLWPDGSRYEGDFRADLRHGDGKHWWSSGEVSRSLFPLLLSSFPCVSSFLSFSHSSFFLLLPCFPASRSLIFSLPLWSSGVQRRVQSRQETWERCVHVAFRSFLHWPV